jgi:L-fucose isomerase-like protein
MKTRVKVVFPADQPDAPSWPYIGYDVEKRTGKILAALGQRLPEFDFEGGIYRSREQAGEALPNGRFDGYLVYMTALWTGIEELYARKARPVIVADELYSGSGGFLRVHSMIKKERLPVVGVASSDFEDIIEAVRLFEVLRRMRETRILMVADRHTWAADQKMIDDIQALFGTEVIWMNSGELQEHFDRVDVGEAEAWKDRWIREALKVVEPDEAEIRRSARMYLALESAMHAKEADAVTVDCLGLYYAGKLSAYPCLGFFQLNNEGSTGVCEADLESTITQLLIRYATSRPAYVSDPVIDTGTGQIIYAHCVATNCVFGCKGPCNPYIIRSHAEDQRGASVQSLMPLGHDITTVKVSVRNKAFAVHSGRSVANVEDDKACRTKLAAEVNAQAILENYHSELFGWHRVTFYGDYRKQFLNLATLCGLEVFQEDC